MFTLRLNFDGLLHYVENYPDKVDRFCVLLPKAPSHTGRISASKGTGLGGDDAGEIAIDGQRVVFQFERDSDAPPQAFDFETPVIAGSVKGAVPLDDIAGGFVDLNKNIVSTEPPSSVRSQVLIGVGGVFRLAASDSPPKLKLPNDLAKEKVIDIAEGMYMQVTSVTSAQVVVLPLKDSTTKDAVYKITPDEKNTASLTLAHTCVPTTPVTIGSDDKDFQYHYLMLDKLPNGRTIKKMPVPKIIKFSGISTKDFHAEFADDVLGIKPDGCNCAGTRGLARKFDLSKFMTV